MIYWLDTETEYWILDLLVGYTITEYSILNLLFGYMMLKTGCLVKWIQKIITGICFVGYMIHDAKIWIHGWLHTETELLRLSL